MATFNRRPDSVRAAQIISDAGGRVVGRTKLQKIAYLLEATGLGEGFAFEYRHYGPYSEELASAARSARLLKALDEDEHPTTWGGFYSIYTVAAATTNESPRTQLAKMAAEADPIALELAATAAFLATEGHVDPWGETHKRKPEKAKPTRMKDAQILYKKLQGVKTPTALPPII